MAGSIATSAACSPADPFVCRTRGVVVIGDDRPVPLGDADLELAVDLGRRAASALERAQLWQLSQQQLAAEHHMVEVLQESIMPQRLP